jgi:serine-type D-Ala-D-Ala endopeptidase (penicillin-binding protein 7)
MRFLVVLALVLAASTANADDLPEVKSKAVAVLDSDSGVEVFGKDSDEVRAIASTTKIFVAMAVRAHKLELDAYTEITKDDAKESKGGARTRLDVGEKFKNRDLLRAMLIASDNRAPTALGRAAGLDKDELVKAMSKVAKDLGLKKTKLVDPSGLHGNTSTAREMAIALRAALADPVLREIMGEEYAMVYAKGRKRGIGYGSTNGPLVSKRYDVIGGKTGFTTPAGYCFITAVRVDGRELLTVFLGAPTKGTRFEDFNRVAAWLDRGAPGSKVVLRKSKAADADRGRIADKPAKQDP